MLCRRTSALTYGELERAGEPRWPTACARLGVGPGRAGGALRWSARSTCWSAVLAILKAGGAYVPLDAAWPAERVEAILAGTGAPRAGRRRGARCRRRPGAASALPALGRRRSGDWRIPASATTRPAPVGGRGRPRLPDPHLGLDRRAEGDRRPPPLGGQHPALEQRDAGDRARRPPPVRQLDLLRPLDLGPAGHAGRRRRGARGHRGGAARPASGWRALLREEGITTWNSAPAALLQLVPFFPPAGRRGRSLRRVLLAGDWIPLALPDRSARRFPGAVIGNFGGATETSVWSNWYRVGAVDPAWAAIPYGRPLANTRYYVLDARLEPCPPGVPGDNYIGGGCPALGYAGAAGAHRRAVPPRSLLAGAGGRHVRDRRPRALRAGRHHGVPGPRRLPGQGARLPHRAGGDRGGAAAPSRGARRRWCWRARTCRARSGWSPTWCPPAGRRPTAAELREFLQRPLPEYMVPWSFVILDRRCR